MASVQPHEIVDGGRAGRAAHLVGAKAILPARRADRLEEARSRPARHRRYRDAEEPRDLSPRVKLASGFRAFRVEPLAHRSGETIPPARSAAYDPDQPGERFARFRAPEAAGGLAGTARAGRNRS